MLTRLKVSGFKNLVDADVRFGPFTCIAGPNGVGKSNLFDAILFLGATADRTLVEAAKAVRDEANRTGDIRAIFHRVGEIHAEEIGFEADMILPSSGTDELGQSVEASTTFVSYKLRLGLRDSDSPHQEAGAIEVLEERLVPLRLRDADEHLLFPKQRDWLKSVLQGRRSSDFISTVEKLSEEENAKQTVVSLHQDRRSGHLFTRPAASLRRTLLSTVQAGEYPTAMLVRRELQSWRQLHLESSALRQSDPFTAPVRMGMGGLHLPASLYHLARRAASSNGQTDEAKVAAVYARVANRLAELIEDVRDVSVVRDETQQRFILCLRSRDGTIHQASALSDGTLRFLALAVTEFDDQSGGLLCFEEPENGIHPRRIPAMLRLLEDIATDPCCAVDRDNPLRQVIINTHSPSVVRLVPEEALLVAELVEGLRVKQRTSGSTTLRFNELQFGCLKDTWRAKELPEPRITSKASLLAYLNPAAGERHESTTRKRVMDRPDLQMFLGLPIEG
ncbi:MAG: AAA family ATPase [Verrucomicrobia bacterium]|nr:AAA family ATPase [Verrucomicrobiota bacterium]